MVILVKLANPLHRYAGILSTSLPKINSSIPVILLKGGVEDVKLEQDFTFQLTVFNPEQLEKTLSPIVATELGIVMLVKPVQFSNAE